MHERQVSVSFARFVMSRAQYPAETGPTSLTVEVARVEREALRLGEPVSSENSAVGARAHKVRRSVAQPWVRAADHGRQSEIRFRFTLTHHGDAPTVRKEL